MGLKQLLERLRGDNHVEREDDIIRKIASGLKDRLYQSTLKHVDIYFSEYPEPTTLESIFSTPGFRKDLIVAAQDKGVPIDSSTDIRFDPVTPAPEEAFEVCAGVKVVGSTVKSFPKASNATLKVYGNSGILERATYVLEGKVHSRYKVGRGENVVLDDGLRRHNDIVIKAVEGDAFQEGCPEHNNLHVSRKQCLIEYHEGKFLLSNEGDDTRILRDEQKIKLLSPLQKVALKDGDIIVLNRKVMLLFNLNKD